MSTEEAKKARRDAGRYIKSLRANIDGMTQATLAKTLNYDWPTFVAQIESGHSRVPSEAMGNWARALQVDPSEFAWNLLRFYDNALYRLLAQQRKSRP